MLFIGVQGLVETRGLTSYTPEVQLHIPNLGHDGVGGVV